MHNNEILILDFDNVLYFGNRSSALEDFLRGAPNKKARFFYPALLSYMMFTKAIQRIIQFKSGESTVLTALDIILRKHPIDYNYLIEFSEKAAKNIPNEIISELNKIEIPRYIVTSEPVDLVEMITRNAGLNFDGVYGNKFEISNRKIVGFQRYCLCGGMSAKYFRAKLLIKDYKEGYGTEPSKIYAIGDSIADKGINGHLGVPVKRYDVGSKLEVINSIRKVVEDVLSC